MAWTREVGSSVLSPADGVCIGVLGSAVLSRQGRPKGLDWARVSFLWGSACFSKLNVMSVFHLRYSARKLIRSLWFISSFY